MSVEGKTKNIENCLNMLEVIAHLHEGIEVEMELHVQELPQDGNDHTDDPLSTGNGEYTTQQNRGR